jgi:hypothetical protein
MIRRKCILDSIRRIVILAAAVPLLLGVAAQGAQATTDGPTRGDAAALLNTYPTTAIIGDQYWSSNHERMLDIRPFPAFDDFGYCVEDWHLVAYAQSWGDLCRPRSPGRERRSGTS